MSFVSCLFLSKREAKERGSKEDTEIITGGSVQPIVETDHQGLIKLWLASYRLLGMNISATDSRFPRMMCHFVYQMPGHAKGERMA